jgi:secreted PhoX family phosphatase
MFNSPDGLAFDRNGMLWIQTDGNYGNKGDFAGQGNNQMLVGDPASGEIRRFLVGPKQCEVTGFAWSPDNRTLFVGIQHPGEKGDSHFPDGGDTTPRSAVIAITRDDGGPYGCWYGCRFPPSACYLNSRRFRSDIVFAALALRASSSALDTGC